MIIPRGRGIILSGNRQIAGQFVQIAKRRALELAILLDMSNLKMGQKKYMLDRDCVWCTINIIDNATFIRIHACSESKCGECGTIKITPSTLTPVSGWPILNETPTLIDMVANAGGCWDPEHHTWEVYSQYITNFGDGTGGYAGITIFGEYNPVVKHWYREPGAYTVTTKAWNKYATSTKRPTELTRTTYHRQGGWYNFGTGNEGQAAANAAWALCNAQPWSVIEPVSGDLYYSGHIIQRSADNYKVFQRYTVWTWSLSDEWFFRTLDEDTGLYASPPKAQYWIQTSCGHVSATYSEHTDMGTENIWWHRHQRADFLGIEINGTTYPAQVADGNYILMALDVTDILPPLIAAGGTLSITFKDRNDFAVPLAYPGTYRGGEDNLSRGGWSSYKIFHLSSANPNCVTYKTQTALINAT